MLCERMGTAYSILGVVCFSGFYLLLDHSQKRRKTDPFGLNVTIFCAATLIGIVADGGIRPEHFPARLLAVGSLMGLAAGVGLLGVTLAAHSGLSITVINTSVSLTLGVPIMLSLVLYREVPGPRKALGLLFATLSILLISRTRR
jgi:drug/metabolite transporter (DMT)-like permease